MEVVDIALAIFIGGIGIAIGTVGISTGFVIYQIMKKYNERSEKSK